jgi:hypothetical protein
MKADDLPGKTTDAPAGDSAQLIPADAPRPLFPDDIQSIKIAVFEAAITRHSASFTQLATSIFYSRERFTSNPIERKVNERYIRPLTDAFEAAHGPIMHSFYCQNVIAAAALTERHELCVVPPALDPDIVPIAELLFVCDRLSTEADRVLSGPERCRDWQTAKTLTYGVVVKLLSLLDNPTHPPPRSIIDLHKREAEHAQDYYRRAADRYAKLDYFRGMWRGTVFSLGLIASAALILIISGMFSVTPFIQGLNREGVVFLGCLIAGAMGAVVSVMSRMTFGGLILDYEAGRAVLTLLGVFRPVIGMALGAAMWVLTASGVLAVVPNDSSKLSFFRILTAFLAGFSERWAQDMLGRTAEHIAGRGVTASREGQR